MPRPYPPEFRAIALVRAGKQAEQTAVELGIHPVTLSKWLRQDDIDNGRRPGTPSSESAQLRGWPGTTRPPARGARALAADCWEGGCCARGYVLSRP
ncbi:hypothetical protein H180DRAFT_05348 [Streptomyces sp. WMMB 322]|nr:hypothetical protein H180DRAFT_05348 [Streptomyces sp. WMMB 322]